MHKTFIFLCCLFILAGACQPDEATRKPTTITIGGATAMLPLLQALTAEFSRKHPHILFDLSGGGSTIGEDRVRIGTLNLGASTLISPTVASGLSTGTKAGALIRIPIGLDGLAIIVHATNPITTLTATQLQNLYSGRLFDWAEVGGPTGEVLLVSREDGSGSRRLFEERIMGNARVALTAVVMPTSADVVDFVSSQPMAIGYLSRAYVLEGLETLPIVSQAPTPVTPEAQPATVRVVALENQLPTTETIQQQTYLLIQPLYLVSRGQPQGWVQKFVDFVITPAGQNIVAQYHVRVR